MNETFYKWMWRTEPGGTSMTMIEPLGAVSTKWDESLGSDRVCDAKTICTVYAGPQIRTLGFGVIALISGI
jgi:hypothetical protein